MQRQEEEKKEEELQHKQALEQVFNQFLQINSFLRCALDDVLAFQEDLQKIAATINKTLRSEQLVTLGLLLLS